MSAFDADSFLSQEIEANFDTEYTPCPEGEHEGQVLRLAVSSFTDKETQEDKPILKLFWNITEASVLADLGVEEMVVPQTVFLDFEGGVLLTGANKNITLGQLKEMAGNPKNFVLTDLVGISGICRVKQRMLDDGRPVAEVKSVAAA